VWYLIHLHLERKQQAPPTAQCCDVVYLACWQNLQPPRRQRPQTASEMLLDGFCGHRPMIWRISDMVSVVDQWSMMMGVLWVQGKRVRKCKCKNHGHWYLVLGWALTVNVGSSWINTTWTLAIQYRISELFIFNVRYCEMLRSEVTVHRNSVDPTLDAVDFFVADTGFCWVGTLSGASGSRVQPFF
jgi:hypothetical protein